MKPQEFIRENRITNGQVIVIVGGAGSGKTQVSEWLGVGLAHQDPNQSVCFVNPELPFSQWQSRMRHLKAPSNLVLASSTPRSLLSRYRCHMVFDNPLLCPTAQKDPKDFMEHVKSHCKSSNTVTVVTAQLPRKQCEKLDLEKWLSPEELPEWMRAHTDTLFFTHRDEGDYQLFSGMHGGSVSPVVNRYGVAIGNNGIVVTP